MNISISTTAANAMAHSTSLLGVSAGADFRLVIRRMIFDVTGGYAAFGPTMMVGGRGISKPTGRHM
jgi:hypothetical protein